MQHGHSAFATSTARLCTGRDSPNERLGEALADRPRDAYTVSTKVGRILVPGAPPVFDFSPAAVRRSLRESLERLQLDRVDVALLHDPEDHMDDARRAIETVRKLVPRVGVGTNVVATARSFVEWGEIDLVLLAGRYTLLDRSAGDELLDAVCRPWSVGGRSWRLQQRRARRRFDVRLRARASRRPRAAARARTRVRSTFGVPLAAAAIQFPLRHPAVTSVLVGARSPEEVAEDVRLFAHPVPGELWSELESIVIHST